MLLPDGTQINISLYYSPQQYGWFVTDLTYGSFEIQGLRITVSPNMLHQFRNQLPFGIACFITTANREPTQQQDFSSELFQLFVLDATEVEQYTEFLASGT